MRRPEQVQQRSAPPRHVASPEAMPCGQLLRPQDRAQIKSLPRLQKLSVMVRLECFEEGPEAHNADR
jgi:hypothetical protein